MDANQLIQQLNDIGISIAKIQIDESKNTILFHLKADSDSPEMIRRGVKMIQDAFPEFRVSFEYSFSSSAFGPSSLDYISKDIQSRGVPINGFLNGASLSVDGSSVTIQLKAKSANALSELSFESEFIRSVKRLYDFIVSDIHILEPENKVSADRPRPTTASKVIHHLDEEEIKQIPFELVDDQYEIILGTKGKIRKIDGIQSFTSAPNRGIFTGVVVEVKTTELREATLRQVLVTDYNNSIYIQVFDDTGEYKALSSLSEKDTIIVSGNSFFNKRDEEYIFQPRWILRVQRQSMVDSAEEKRVELHLHTNMSQMDGIPSATDVIMHAARLGHHGVAITDHGSVQAYPEAYSAQKKARSIVDDFKVMYGCEVYYVDDSAKIITGNTSGSFQDEVICFDLETTGFDCENERIIEIGACLVKDGEITETFGTFVNPHKRISDRITELTGITNDMVANAPDENEALTQFFQFCGNRVLVAHNASFDMSFIKAACNRLHRNEGDLYTYIDSLALSQTLLQDLTRHRLDTLTKYFKLPQFDHHRGIDDAIALGRIYLKLVELVTERGIIHFQDAVQNLHGRNTKHAKSFHMILLVKNKVGLKNLYTLISKSNLEYFHVKPRVPLSELMKYREGLVIGSACEAGELYRAVLEHRPKSEILSIAEKYDYFEIQPRTNNLFLLREDSLENEEQLLDVNRRIVALADELGKPCVATADVHYIHPEDALYRQILQFGMGFSDSDSQADLSFKTTDYMLNEFAYLGKEKAYEVVVTNPNKIMSWLEADIQPIPDGSFSPSIPGSEEEITESSYRKLHEIYGEDIDPVILERTKKELDSICGNHYAFLYLIAQKLVEKSESDGYHVGSRGSVGSSLIAFLLNISEVNPLPPHYVCPKCKHFEFVNGARNGFDLPAKQCPVCGEMLTGDGHDIPFETFLGFHGEKQPDIDLNFSSEYQNKIFKYTEELFGSQYVFKAGTIMALKDKNAMGYVRKFAEENNLVMNKAEMRRLALGCTGVKKSTGQHPGGMVVIPSEYDINDFTPVQRPADKSESDFVTTHFDFNSLHDTLLKLDELGHEIPTVYHYLEEFSGINIQDVPINDPKVFSLFSSPEALGVKEEDIDSKTGTFGVPEMGTTLSREILTITQPSSVADLIQVSGLSHGTGVWKGNALDLINSNTCTISDVIGTRDGIMLTLIEYGVDKNDAFRIMEFVRKNKNSKPLPQDMIDIMKEHNLPDWYIESCKKIQYMFPKAHAAAYVTSAIKVSWFKLYHPLDFYAAYFTARGCNTDVEYIQASVKTVKKHLAELRKKTNDVAGRSAKDEDEIVALQLLIELKMRQIEFLPVDIRNSHWKKFLIENGKLRLPFIVLKGVGESAARSLYDAVQNSDIDTAEDLLSYPGISKTLIDTLDELGALGNMPKTRQLSFF